MRGDQFYQTLLHYSLNLVARKRYTTAEMQKKLNSFVAKITKFKRDDEHNVDSSSAVDSVINRLIELKYLDDARYASDYVAQRAKLRPRGIFLMRNELRKKGLSSEEVEKAINVGIDSKELDETEMAKQILQKKLGSWQKLDPVKIKSKCFAFLASKGFRPDAIYKAIKQCYDPSVIEDL